MANKNNVIEAKFNAKDKKSVIGPLWQYDYGQILKITGIELPEIFEVQFSNDPRGIAKVISGTPEGVPIPDEYLTTGANVFAWLFLHTGSDDGGTEYQIEIQVRRKARPVNIAPTPIEQNIITNLIADIGKTAQAVNAVKEETEKLSEAAEDSMKLAQQASDNAERHALNAGSSAQSAAESAEKAEEAAKIAQDIISGNPGASDSSISEHNTNASAHNDIRIALQNVVDRVNAILDCDDETLDQTSEIVAYIKSNRTLIESITTGKVSVADIVNDLVTNVQNKPLSAAQGVVLKGLIDELNNQKLDAEEFSNFVSPGAEKAGMLLYIGQDGNASCLKLGDGIAIEDNTLTVAHSDAVEETEDDAMEMLTEMGIVDPVSDGEGNVLTDYNGNILII